MLREKKIFSRTIQEIIDIAENQIFWTNESEKQSITIFCTSLLKKELSGDSDQKKEGISLFGIITWQWPNKETSRHHDQKKPYLKDNLQHQSQSLTFFTKTNHFFKLPVFYLTTKPHHLQYYCFLGQAQLYRLCGLWKMSRQIWSIFLAQKWFQLLCCKVYSVPERWQRRLSPEPKSHSGRGRFQADHALEESAGHSSRKLW